MTAIACFRIANVAMLFGDLLLSAKTPPARQLDLPAIGPLTPDGIKREYYPVGFAQKVCPINDNLIVAWAGPQFVASSVIKGMRETFAASPVTQNSLDRLFREFGVHERDDSQFIGIYNEGGRHTTFGINTYNIDHPVLGHCHIGGSGSGRLLLAAEAIVGPKHSEGSIRNVDEAINAALTFANQFLAEEMLAGLQETNFGGGFEIGTVTTRGAEKVGDTLNLFWQYEPKNGPIPLLKPTLIKWDYNGSDLVAQRLAFEQKQNGELVTTAHTISVITPPDLKPIDRYPIPPDLNCRYLCNLYYRTYEDNSARTISSIFHAGTKEGPARFDLGEKGKMSLHFNRQHLEREWEIMRDALA